MKTIPMHGVHGHGKFALVDDGDFELLSKYRWNMVGNYARTKINYVHIKMHKMLVNVPEGMVVDHVDGNPLNNQRSNLRTCTTAENTRNRPGKANSKSAFKGVCYISVLEKRCKPPKYYSYWKASIMHAGKKYQKKCTSEKEAAIQYNIWAIKYHGEFAKLNVIS